MEVVPWLMTRESACITQVTQSMLHPLPTVPILAIQHNMYHLHRSRTHLMRFNNLNPLFGDTLGQKEKQEISVCGVVTKELACLSLDGMR